MPSYFTQTDAWTGGFYELALELGERDDSRLFNTLQTIWKHNSLDGCYLDSRKEPHEQPKVLPPEITDSGMHLYGLARLPNSRQVPCGTVVIRETDGSDWLDFYLPMGGLGQAYDVGGYPFDVEIRSPDHWQKPIDDFLAELGKVIFTTVPFALGLIGHEVSSLAYAHELARDGIPAKRDIGYLWPVDGSLQYLERNN